MCQDISVYFVLCIGVLVAILAVFVNDHDKRLEALDSLSTHLGKRVENLTRENEKLTEIIEVVFVNNHEKRLKELDTLSSQLGKKVENLTKEDEKLKEIIEGNSMKVTFTAGTHAPGTTASGHTLVFPVVINNEGGGYDPSSGVFTAPRAGQYVFFVSAQGYSSNTLYVSIVHNGGPKVMTMSDGGRKKDFYDSGSNLVALNLKMGDRVWAQCQSGSHYHSEGIAITTFSGFLV